MQAIVMYSGGIGSWAAGMRAVERYGRDNVTLLFCDTKIEDEDLYRFLEEGAAVCGVPVTRIADGRTPWDVMHEKGYLGGPRFAYCSAILKQELAEAWVRSRYMPDECIRLLGMDFCQKEQRRLLHARQRVAPYQVDAPLFWPPVLDKDLAKLWALSMGLRLPRLYALGFEHNNCGGFCVKAGRAQFAHLLRVFPERYEAHAAQEAAFRECTGKDVAILRDRRGGRVRAMPLRVFAAELTQSPELQFPSSTHDCECFVS